MRRSILFAAFFLWACPAIFAQEYLPFKQIRSYTQKQAPNHLDSSLTYLTNRLGIEIHYLYPLYQAIGWEDRFRQSMGEKNYYESFSQFLAMAGDYAMAAEYFAKSFDPIPDSMSRLAGESIRQLVNIQSMPAASAILDNAGQYRVMMFDEDRSKPLHRAFLYGLLGDLYKKGYRYLAMEELNNLSNRATDSLNVFTGYFTNEPIAGELIRKALALGFQLVPYEDTLATLHAPSQRDSIQAVNLASVLKNDPAAKMIVLATPVHISEEKTDGFTPMAFWFRKMTGTDPLTIEQTSFTEGSNFEFGRIYYDLFNARFQFKEPSVLFQNRRPFNPFELKGYDIIVVHPSASFIHNRPSWLQLGGERQAVLVQPTERDLFFVQAYYETEYRPQMTRFYVPADQTYIPDREGYYGLFLKKGKYKLVLRDLSYKILSIKDLEVK